VLKVPGTSLHLISYAPPRVGVATVATSMGLQLATGLTCAQLAAAWAALCGATANGELEGGSARVFFLARGEQS
jgi:hypothetical protein